jgi:hypothetical protein
MPPAVSVKGIIRPPTTSPIIGSGTIKPSFALPLSKTNDAATRSKPVKMAMTQTRRLPIRFFLALPQYTIIN